jgi:hypothetical protein
MKFRLPLILAVAAALIAGPAKAHIGSPAVVFDGAAGPYSIRVIILPPPVIPGRAEINVRLLNHENEPVKVTVLPVDGRAGLTGAPPPDEATVVPGEPALRHGELWLMSAGSYSVHVAVEGALGRGTVIVPVVAAATQRLAMPAALEIILFALGALLFIGAATLVGTGVRESVLPPGAPLTASQRRQGYVAVGLAAVVLATSLYGGMRWCDAVDRDYRNNEIYRPNPLAATVSGSGDSRVLHLSVERHGTYSRDRLLLIPDHGKLMHLFMIREPQLDVLAHIHPVRSGPRSFEVSVPPLPDGRYRLYADITYETGFAATLTTTVDLNPGPGASSTAAIPSRDPDDSWHIENHEAGPAEGPRLVLTSGRAVRAGEDVSLGFTIEDEAGRPSLLEPYMGMLGHAAVRRSDGSVFAHLHPVGTISMAAEEFFTEQTARETGTTAPMDHSMHLSQGGAGNSVSFPYLFPQPGSYRIWAQVKVAGKVVTGVFDLEVAPALR